MENKNLLSGAGKAEIRLDRGIFPWEDFHGSHDPLHVRTVFLQKGERVLLVSLELTSIPDEQVEVLKKAICDRWNFKRRNIWISVTHTFSAPHLLPPHMLTDEEMKRKREKIRAAVQNSVMEAVRQAVENAEAAALGIGLGCCQVNVNRDVETAEGWWIGRDELGPSDKALHVIRIDSLVTNRPIALLYHYAVQSSVTDLARDPQGRKLVSSDLTGYASTCIEENAGAPVALYLMGAAGDQAPQKKADGETPPETAFRYVEELGSILAKEVLRVSGRTETAATEDLHLLCASVLCPAQKMNPDIRSLRPCRNYTFEADGEKETGISLIQTGDIVLIGVQPELGCYTALEIKAGSRFRYTLPVTMVNGAAKYMASAEAYDRCTYEAMNSPFAKGAAEILCGETAELLKQLNGCAQSAEG